MMQEEANEKERNNRRSTKTQDQQRMDVGGAEDGKGHFDVTIVSSAFEGQNRLGRHRMVYDVLTQLIQTDIHALRLKALTPSER